MNHPDYNSPSELKNFMESHNMAMQKKFGQNFMINPKARTQIVKDLEVDSSSYVWEIGPGLGCMTDEILSSGAQLTAFEIDKGFIPLLHEFFKDYEEKGKFSIVEGDVLKNWKKKFEEVKDTVAADKIKLFGNLPYNIAATFIAETITSGLVFQRCVFTVQKEVTQRICAAPSTENYSAFSVLCQWAYDVKPGIVLGPGNFWPKPNVASQSVIFTPKKDRLYCSNPDFLVKLIHALFSSRRKTVNNNIKGILPSAVDVNAVFEKAGISPSERAENLSIEKFIALSESCCEAINALKK